MRNYYIALANAYNLTSSPLVVNVGFYNQKTMDYQCITKLDKDDYIVLVPNKNMTIIDTNIVQTINPGSYTIQVIDRNDSENVPLLYNFSVITKPFTLNQDLILRTINRELPNIYKSSELFNNADNFASAGVLSALYDFIYQLYWNSITSIGVENGYNSSWEYVYIGVNNFLNNAIDGYPAQFLRTLMNVNTQTSVQGFSLAQTLSRLIYQFTGTTAPVVIEYIPAGRKYYINIYYSITTGWLLGIPGRSELGITTYLESGSGNAFLWILSTVIERLMPAFVGYQINYITIDVFNDTYNVTDVGIDDYIDPAVIYDAYEVVNNNNNFNTRGYLKLS